MTRSRLTARARLAVLVTPLALLTVACGKSSGGAQSTGAGSGAVVTIKKLAYQPARVEIRAGQTVTWRFEDAPTPHTVTAADHSFDSGTMTSGEFNHAFDKPGTYDYNCTVHPQQMRGTVVVR